METRQDLEPSIPEWLRSKAVENETELVVDEHGKRSFVRPPFDVPRQRVDTSLAVFSLARRLSDRAIRERCLEASTVARAVEWAAELAVRSGHDFTSDELKKQLQELHQAATFLGRK